MLLFLFIYFPWKKLFFFFFNCAKYSYLLRNRLHSAVSLGNHLAAIFHFLLGSIASAQFDAGYA